MGGTVMGTLERIGMYLYETDGEVSFKSGNAFSITLSSDKTQITANGTDTATVTAQVKSWDGSPIPILLSVTFTLDSHTQLIPVDATGKASITLQTSATGAHVINASHPDIPQQSITIQGA